MEPHPHHPLRQAAARAPNDTSPNETRQRGAEEAVGIAIALALLIGLTVVAFGLPAVHTAPHDVPLAISAPPPAIAQIRDGLERNAPGAFVLSEVQDEEALRSSIQRREVYGGFVVTSEGTTILTASAASPPIAQALRQVGAGMSASSGKPVPVVDVVPLPADDPNGMGIVATALPLALGGILPALAFSQIFPGRVSLQLASATAFALAAGMITAGILHAWFGTLTGNYWLEAGVVALGILATSLTLLGLHAAAGKIALGIGAAVVLLVGNPLSGIATGPDLLPAGWGALGQLLPQGATATLLRASTFFEGHGGGAAALVLVAWVLLGLTLAAGATLLRTSRSAPRRLHPGTDLDNR